MNLVECKIKELSGENSKLPCSAQALKIYMNVLKIFSTIILLSDSECTYGALYIHSTIIFLYPLPIAFWAKM